MASIEAALKNAIQVQYQLEESELSAEPLPTLANRQLILLYESAEGGAGVLRQLVDDPRAFSRVAREALQLCHFDPDTGADQRRAPSSREDCEAACYDCLMSYSNQREHDLLDRQKIRELLLENAFEIYSRDFAATPHPLVRNYRSAPELVRIQQVIAQSIESGTAPAAAARIHATPGTCFVAEFRTPEQEAEYVSDLIANGISQDGLKPREFCVLSRQQTGQMVAILQQTLREKSVPLRDESELQDLLAEPVTQIVLAVLRIVTRARDPEAWEFLNSELAFLLGLDHTDDSRELSAEVKSILTAVRAGLHDANLSRESIPALIVRHVGEPRFRASYRQYTNTKFFTDQVSKCGKALAAVNARDLQGAVDEFRGVDIVPAMTVHKSKGLEFHTVVFLGLEDSQLWNFARQSDEEKRGFFVAFSRAITRVIFTFSDVRDGRFGRRSQSRSEIRDLYTLLQAAGVETRNLRR